MLCSRWSASARTCVRDTRGCSLWGRLLLEGPRSSVPCISSPAPLGAASSCKATSRCVFFRMLYPRPTVLTPS